MNKYFVTYDIAVLIEELGFDEPCLAYYEISSNTLLNKKESVLKFNSNIEYLKCSKKMKYILGDKTLLAPLWQQVIDWIKEKYNIDIIIHRSFLTDKSNYFCIINDCGWEIQQFSMPNKTYDEVYDYALYDIKNLIII